ncbi:MAG TPA: hypothetical protein VFT22_31090 [Kofleriaceae bacterium]|nr:hypothetical protein [Kofleriaceae bacterium]
MLNMWMQWIRVNWRELCAGKWLRVPQAWLAHPQFVEGFERVVGWPKNQTCDWGLSLVDGSRLHVQCYRAPDGTPMLYVHRDKWDPKVSPAMHLLFETPVGPMLGLAALVTAVGVAATRA